jgi:glucose/mannose transport system substrate-binding protein
MVADGDTAFINQRDWAAGRYRNTGLTYGDDWDYAPMPGTGETFLFQSDALLYPENDPSPEATHRYPLLLYQSQRQRRFCAERPSLPARTDVDEAAFAPSATRWATTGQQAITSRR